MMGKGVVTEEPSRLVTVIGPVTAPAGTTTVKRRPSTVVAGTVTGLGTPVKVTVSPPCNPSAIITIVDPTDVVWGSTRRILVIKDV
jgi:hypothetical protein